MPNTLAGIMKIKKKTTQDVFVILMLFFYG